MKHRIIHIFALILLAVASPAYLSAAPVQVKAKLDSVQILMGRMANLRLEVVQNKGAKGEFEIFKSAPADGIVGLCGDSVELRTAVRRDTVDLGSGRIQINYSVPVQAFDSGFYQLPQLRYISGRDTALSNSVSLKVIPVAVTADAAISGYADVADPADASWLDKLPDFIYNYWWIILLVLVVAGVCTYLMIRLRKTGSLLAPKPEPSPYIVAMESLRRLKSRKLWEQGLDREYFTELTEILRIYLDKRFHINAMEMTSSQIIDILSADARIKDKKEYVQQVLDMADFVKFAAVRPLPTDSVASFDNVERFIEETKPTPEEEAEAKQKIDDGFEIPAEDKPRKKVKPAKSKAKDKAKKGGRK